MARRAAQGTKVWFDEFSLSGLLTAADLSISQEQIPVTTLDDTGPRRLVGNYDHSASLNAFFDGVASGFDSVAWSDLNTDEDHYLAQAFGSGSEGQLVYEQVCRLTDQPRSGQIGQAILLNLSVEGSGALARGLILRSATVTGTGNGTGYFTGQTTASQLFVITYRLIAVGGGPGSITLLTQESNDDGATDPYSTLAGSSQALTVPGVVRVTVAGGTDGWKRVVVNGFTGFTSAVILATGTIAAG